MAKNLCRVTDLCTGHGCYPSRPNDQGSFDVFTNGLANHRQTDHWSIHCCNLSPFDCHDSFLLEGSPTVFTNGLQQGRVGDPVACGSLVLTGSPDTFVGP